MPSYDKPKLLAMIEQRRAAYASLSDLSARLRDARNQRSNLELIIRANAHSAAAPSEFVERLLAMPQDEAYRLQREDVESYAVSRKGYEDRYTSGINFATYQSFIDARRRFDRLQPQVDAASEEMQTRFAIVGRLCDAVRAWGFRNPEQEV